MDRKALIDLAAFYSHKVYSMDDGGCIHSRLTDATAAMFHVEQLQIVSFRGSDHWKDWLLNATAIPIPWRGALIHAGFRAHAAPIFGEIKRRIDPYKPLLITGHSLGGGDAEQLAYVYKHHPRVHLITFGKPNVWARWRAPRLSLSGHQISCVHGSDLVARIPRFAYRPSKGQDMLYFSNSGADKWNPPKEYRKKDWTLGDAVKDHSMPDYLERVANYMKTGKGYD